MLVQREMHYPVSPAISGFSSRTKLKQEKIRKKKTSVRYDECPFTSPGLLVLVPF